MGYKITRTLKTIKNQILFKKVIKTDLFMLAQKSE